MGDSNFARTTPPGATQPHRCQRQHHGLCLRCRRPPGLTTTDALGGITQFAYDAAGNKVQQIDALGQTFLFAYNALNQRTATTHPDGAVAATGYDVMGTQDSEMDPAGRTSTLPTTVTATGWPWRIRRWARRALPTTLKTGCSRRPTPTAASLRTPTTRTDAARAPHCPAGKARPTTTMRGAMPSARPTARAMRWWTSSTPRSAASRATIQAVAGSSSRSRRPTALRPATDSRGGTSYTYDLRDRIARIDNPDGSSLAYGYDAVGNRISVTAKTAAAAAPRTTTYTYDALNRLSTASGPGGLPSRRMPTTRSAISRKLPTPNSTATQYTYDSRSFLSVLRHRRGAVILDEFTYTVNAVGDRTRVDALDGSFVTYHYDALRRLTREVLHDTGGAVVYDVIYAYDAVGNRLSRMLNGGPVVAYVYDSNDRLLAQGGATQAHDANGNVTGRSEGGQTTTYEYDFENRLVRTQPQGALPQTLLYDTQGNRVRKTGPGGAVNYLVDPVSQSGLPQVLDEYDSAGNSLASYVHGHQLISQQRGGLTSYFHRDATNSTRALTDGGGNVTDRYAYDAFGTALAQSGATANVYRFAGEQVDVESGLYYLRARYYSPESGRFFSVDPYGGAQADPVSLHR
ncbi:MAG: RHS repeat-associated core domain-containing protein [Betaproteobacteria bacterium]|nr:RHS repeat-associated core domain-containing protein [Betaproteobacteria bacterium]